MPEKRISQDQLDVLEILAFAPGVGIMIFPIEPEDSLKMKLMKKENYFFAFPRRKVPYVFDHDEITDDSFETVIMYGEKHEDFVEEVLKESGVIFEKASDPRMVGKSYEQILNERMNEAFDLQQGNSLSS